MSHDTHRCLRPATPIYFEGPPCSVLNNYSGLPDLLRDVAIFLDANPQINGANIIDLVISSQTHDGDESFFAATLYVMEGAEDASS